MGSSPDHNTVVMEDSLWNNTSSALTTTSASTVANPDTSLSIVPNCQIIDLVLAFNHKAADLPSDKSIPFQKKGWCHGQVTVSFCRLGSGVFRQGYFPNRKST